MRQPLQRVPVSSTVSRCAYSTSWFWAHIQDWSKCIILYLFCLKGGNFRNADRAHSDAADLRSILTWARSSISSRRTTWIKTDQTVERDKDLLSILPHCYEFESHYDSPIYIHHRTSDIVLRLALNKIANVRLFIIAMQFGHPSLDQKHSTPALLNIQRIRHEASSTIFLIEMRHLPSPSSPLFSSIQRLCALVFSLGNRIVSWDDVIHELTPFEEFDSSQVPDTVKWQQYFTDYWNQSHPHTYDGRILHQPLTTNPIPDDYLLCVVNSDDINDEFNPLNTMGDHNTCICPDDLRPYKAKNSVWSLQRAIQFIFHESLNISHTANIWSRSLDPLLDTDYFYSNNRSRADLTSYAINTLFAITNLYFHLERSTTRPPHSTASVALNNVIQNKHSAPSSFIVLADSHAKHFL